MAKNELAIVKEFSVVSRYEGMSEEEIEELKDQLGDLDEERGISCRQIKVPSGGGKAFEVETDDPDDPEPMKESQGVIVFTHKINSYWEGAFETSDNKAPTCASMDAKTGVNMETGEICECEHCPHNLFKDDGSGKDCKNMRRIYILMSGRRQIYMLSVPPTSMKDVNKQLVRIMGANMIPYSKLVVSFKLDTATNRNSIKYSKVTVERVGLLDDEQAKVVAAMRKELKDQYKNVAITADDYNVADEFVQTADVPFQEAPQAAPEAPVQEAEQTTMNFQEAPGNDFGGANENAPFA